VKGSARKMADQGNCDHRKLTRTIVGGFTCKRCGIYLFHLPDEEHPERYNIADANEAPHRAED
jgi:hypothetical protein